MGFYDIRATNGNINLGGSNFDSYLVKHCIEHLKSDCLHVTEDEKSILGLLRKACETAKRQLSSIDHLNIPLKFDEDEYAIPITREMFEKMIDNDIKMTMKCVAQALKEANMTNDQIDEIVLVGGSSQIPLVQKELENMFGKKLNSEVDPVLSGKKKYKKCNDNNNIIQTC